MGQNLNAKTILFVGRREYVPRSCNRVAHALAALGCKRPLSAGLCWESTPSFVKDLEANNRTASLR